MLLTEQLRTEHEQIRRRLSEWDDLLAESESGIGTFAALRLKDEATWVRDELLLHLEREEAIALPALQKRNLEADERLQRLCNDHDQLRQLAEQLMEIAWKRQLGAATNQQAQTLLKTFRRQLLDHLAREEGSLPPLLMQSLSVDEDKQLLRLWQSYCPTEVGPKGLLTELNGRIHAWLDELLLRHLEAMTSLNLPTAKLVWQQFADDLSRHAQAEDKVALPVYERLGAFPEGGQPSLLAAEHKGIKRMLKTLTQRLESLSPTDPTLRRKVVVGLDRYMLFRHLIEHHTLREQNIFYPMLDEKADAEEKFRIADALEKAWWGVVLYHADKISRRCVAMKSVEALMHEHRVIEHGLEVLEVITERLERGETVPEDKVVALLDFFSVFADRCHHGKEEGVLFPELEARGIQKDGGPIGVMLYEHEEGRILRRQMSDAATDLTDSANREKFANAAQNYIALLREHIWKEDNVLFKMAEQVLTEREDEQLAERFDRHEREQIGESVHERYHHLIHELEAEFVTGTEQHGVAEEPRGEKVLDVRTIPPRDRHPLIFQTFEALKHGESFILVNDHDPKPLCYEFHYERQGQFTWEYLEQGPEVWRVRIGKVG